MKRSEPQTTDLTVSLPPEDLKLVRTLVSTGAFRSDSDVVCEGLRILRVRQQTMDKWLRDEAIPTFHRLKGHPATGMSVDELRVALDQRLKGSG